VTVIVLEPVETQLSPDQLRALRQVADWANCANLPEPANPGKE
jgi:hypothetical protein